jgi:cytochrome c551
MKVNILIKIFCLSAIHFLYSCTTDNGQQNLTIKERIKLKQYMVQGEALYLNQCSNCHQVDGSGLKRLIPPLAGNNHIKENQNRLACILKFGMTGKLNVNDIVFNQNMPGNLKLTNLQIAEILTYVGNSWENKVGLVEINYVEQSLSNCTSPQ